MQTQPVETQAWWSAGNQQSPAVQEPVTAPQTQPQQPEQIQDAPNPNQAVVQPEVPEPAQPETPKLHENLQGMFGELLEKNKDSIFIWDGGKVENIEDVKDLIELNADHRYQQKLENIEQQWMASQSPAFQQVAEMARLSGSDINKVYDYINGMQRIDDYKSFDTSNPSHAELIIENYMRSRNEPEDVIKDEIKDLTERGKLQERADKYKPVLIKNFEQEQTKKVEDERKAQADFYKEVQENQQKLHGFLTSDQTTNMRLKNEDKQLIYNSLSYNPQVGFVQLHADLDKVIDTNDLETLSYISLLVNDRKRFDELYGQGIKTNVAQNLRRTLQINGTTVEAAQNQQPVQPQPQKQQVVQDDKTPWHLRKN